MSTLPRPIVGRTILVFASLCATAASSIAASGDEGWEWRNPLPHGSGLWQLVESDGRLIATGRAGTIQSTEDGVTWTQRASGSRQHLRSAAAAGRTVVVVGADGAIVTSTDAGQSWTVVPFQSSGWETVVYGAGQWLAAGAGLATSPDGLTWTRLDSPDSGLWSHNLVWTGTRWVMAGANFLGVLPKGGVFHSTDGRIWHRSDFSVPDYGRVDSMLWTGSRLVALTGAKLHTSADGITWNSVSLAGSLDVKALIQTETRVLAFSYGNPGCFTSVTGEIWTPVDPPLDNPGMIFTTSATNGSRVLIGGSNGNLLFSDDNGGTWKSSSSGLKGAIHAIRWFADKWVVAGADGGVSSSPDGVRWAPQSSGILAELYSVGWHGGLWVAGGSVNNGPDFEQKQFGLFTSADGKGWTDRSFSGASYPGWSSPVHHVFHTGERWMAVASGAVLSSTDTITWDVQEFAHSTIGAAWNGSRLMTVDFKPEDDPAFARYSDDAGKTWHILWEVAGSPRAVTWSGSEFLMLSANSLYISATGSPGSWKRWDLPLDLFLRSIYADGDGIVLVGSQWTPISGESAAAVASRDGASWKRAEVPSAVSLNHVSRAGSLYVATGNDGVVLTSGDGLTWTHWQPPTTHELYASGWNGRELLVVGEGGTILAHSSPKAIVPWAGIARADGADDALRLTWRAAPGRTYLIEASTDLTSSWSPLTMSPHLAVGPLESMDFHHADHPPAAERFFRVLQQP